MSAQPVRITGAEYIPDAYEAFLREQAAGNIQLLDYAHFASDPEKFAKKRAWLEKAISEEIRKRRSGKPRIPTAHYYQENYPEIWTKTTKTLLTEEEPHVY